MQVANIAPELDAVFITFRSFIHSIAASTTIILSGIPVGTTIVPIAMGPAVGAT